MNPYQKILRGLRKAVAGSDIRFTYAADGFGVRKKFVPFLHDPEFERAWQNTLAVNEGLWESGALPDIRWRCHTCIWAARNCLRLEGDFAEFGVNTGVLSSMILQTTPTNASGKKFYLFDTFAGIPEDSATEAEKAHVVEMNRTLYAHDGLSVAKRVFAPFDAARFVVGRLPETIATSGVEKLSYVSIDLNSVEAEMAVAHEIWDKMVPGGMIVLDDYGFGGHEQQREAWDAFASGHDRAVMALPTGQGLLMR